MKEFRSFVDVYKQFQKIFTINQKKWAVAVFCMSVLGALFEVLGVSVILPLVQVMIEPEQLYAMPIVGELCVIIVQRFRISLIVAIAACVIFVYLIKNLFLSFLSWLRVKFSSKVQRELSIKMFNSYASRGYTFFRQTNMAVLMRGVNSSVSGVNGVLYAFLKIVAEFLTILCIFAFIIYTDWEMALSMAGMISLCLVGFMFVFKNILKSAGEVYHKSMGEVNKWTLQLFSGIKEVLVLNRTEYFISNYESAYLKRQKGQIKQTVSEEIPAYIIEGICVTGIIIAVCFRIMVLEDPTTFVPQLAAFAVAAFRLLPSVGRISANFNACIFGLPSVKEVYDNIVESEEYDKRNVNVAFEKKIEAKLSFDNELLIKDVSWKYPDGECNVLEDVTISVKKGDAVAFVGPSGAGKSTLADIVLGLFHPQSGDVLLDGKSIFYRRDELAHIMSFVPQSVYLVDDTIRRNVAFGIKDEDIVEYDIWRALEQAQLKEYVEKLPLGLDTVIGERGIRFSGGQAQRLAIARALYTNPAILVLDEATSALDNETERAVMDAIEALQGKITLIIIAHRLTTIKNCNAIYEINNGRAEKREYHELLR